MSPLRSSKAPEDGLPEVEGQKIMSLDDDPEERLTEVSSLRAVDQLTKTELRELPAAMCKKGNNSAYHHLDHDPGPVGPQCCCLAPLPVPISMANQQVPSDHHQLPCHCLVWYTFRSSRGSRN